MGDIAENDSYINIVPNEILLCIFKFLTVKQLLISRQVCKRWKQLLDALLADDSAWERFCDVEFSQNCRDVKLKSPDNLNFCDIYKCLSLWDRLHAAKESIDEFCHSTRFQDEIRNLSIIENGLIKVLTRDGIVYYDVTTQAVAPRERIYGNFAKVIEVGNTVVTFTGFLQLSILTRTANTNEELEIEKVFNNIKYFIVDNNKVYFINVDNEIFSYAINQKDPNNSKLVQYNTDDQKIVAMSVHKGQLHLLCVDHTIRAYQNNRFVTLFTLDNGPNMMHELWQYNFIHNINWKVFFLWVGPLRECMSHLICTIKVYGDLFFIGSESGVLRVYYKPFRNGKLDLFNSTPIRKYNFSHRIDIPVLAIQPILSIDIVEVQNGHKVLVAMPKKITVINYVHDLQSHISKALVPYIDWKSIIFEGCKNNAN